MADSRQFFSHNLHVIHASIFCTYAFLLPLKRTFTLPLKGNPAISASDKFRNEITLLGQISTHLPQPSQDNVLMQISPAKAILLSFGLRLCILILFRFNGVSKTLFPFVFQFISHFFSFLGIHLHPFFP